MNLDPVLKLSILDPKDDKGTLKFLSEFSYRELLQKALFDVKVYLQARPMENKASEIKGITLVLNPHLRIAKDPVVLTKMDPKDKKVHEIHLSTAFVLIRGTTKEKIQEAISHEMMHLYLLGSHNHNHSHSHHGHSHAHSHSHPHTHSDACSHSHSDSQHLRSFPKRSFPKSENEMRSLVDSFLRKMENDDPAMNMFTEGTSKLESMPGEVVEVMAGIMKRWSVVEGNLEQRRKARIERDTALRAAALSSRTNLSLFYPHLLENVSISMTDALSFYKLLHRNDSYGESVKTLRCTAETHGSQHSQMATYQEVAFFAGLPPNEDMELLLSYGLRRLTTLSLGKLINLEELIIENVYFAFQFSLNSSSKVKIPFFSTSLKKIFMTTGNKWDNPLILSARNAAWILTFSPNLETASLGFSVSTDDFKFLKEYSNGFEGVSKVKDLAIAFAYISDDSNRGTYWGLPQEYRQIWKGGSKKTEAIWHLLRVTNRLDALEVYADCDGNHRSPGDESDVFTSCLSAISSSFDTLKHLRLCGIAANDLDPSSTDYSTFKALKIFSFNQYAIPDLINFNEIILPPNVEILCLVFYFFDRSGPIVDQFQEEDHFAQLLKTRSFPKLKEVVVPSAPVVFLGKIIEPPEFSPEYRKVWSKRRSDLKGLEIFKSGKVKLRELKPGEQLGDPEKGETCFSTIRWVSPW